jgi:hypothetical protein
MSGGPTRVLAGHCPAKRLGIDLLIFIYFDLGQRRFQKYGVGGYSVSYGVGSGAKAPAGHIILSDDEGRPLHGLLPCGGDYGRNVT